MTFIISLLIATNLVVDYVLFQDPNLLLSFLSLIKPTNKSSLDMDRECEISREITLQLLDEILNDFGLARKNGNSSVQLLGAIPGHQQTKSEHINMSLVGAVPSLANAIVATQIFEARGGQPQSITVDLQRSHNYIDPDIGMTPTINGQV
jgi:hypothetical protein